MNGQPAGLRDSARLRLALSYAAFLVAAGIAVLFGVYVVLRYVPNYPLTAANPSNRGGVASRQEILDAVVGASGAILLALAVIGVVGGWFVAGWALRPLQRIEEAARVAASGRLDHRVRLSGRNDEFRRLADTFDHMLDRLHDAFTAQERFAANASHELRTPLSTTKTMLDVARRDPGGQDVPRLVERLSATNDRALGLTEALLRLADANAVTSASAPVELDALARECLADGEAEAEASGVRLGGDLSPAPAVGDADLLRGLIENLVRNAIRHNAAPGTAHVSTGRDPATGGAVLRVTNTGPVLTPEMAARLSEPFLRGEGRTHQGTGYGLGLALVARVVEVHRGRLDLTPNPEGGLTVTVTLPAAPQPS